jgi:hypothetical protein
MHHAGPVIIPILRAMCESIWYTTHLVFFFPYDDHLSVAFDDHDFSGKHSIMLSLSIKFLYGNDKHSKFIKMFKLQIGKQKKKCDKFRTSIAGLLSIWLLTWSHSLQF